jgi:hypothetical protein
MPESMIEKILPENLNNLLKRFDKLSGPLAKIV